MKNLKKILLSLVTVLSALSCSKDNDTPIVPAPINEEEVITTVTLVCKPIGGGTTITLISRDLDGVGPTPPVISGNQVPFALNTTYNTEISVLNETITPADDILTEIISEAVDHQFFYQTTGTLTKFVYTLFAESPENFDLNGKPLGIKTRFVTTNSASGTLRITLRHEGDKSAPNVSNGEITNATGATDFEVDYPITVQ